MDGENTADAQPDEMRVDARGLRCPLPVIRLASAARLALPGTVVTVLSTDPAAEPDVAAWCRMRDAELLTQEWTADETGAFLRSEVRIGDARLGEVQVGEVQVSEAG